MTNLAKLGAEEIVAAQMRNLPAHVTLQIAYSKLQLAELRKNLPIPTRCRTVGMEKLRCPRECHLPI